MNQVNFKREMNLSVEAAIDQITEALKIVDFGILSRIDFHLKMKEKLGKDIQPLVILGACNPSLAFEIFQKNKDVTSLLPCNVVIRELGAGRVSIEIAKPTALLDVLRDPSLRALAEGADVQLKRALESL